MIILIGKVVMSSDTVDVYGKYTHSLSLWNNQQISVFDINVPETLLYPIVLNVINAND